MEKKITGYLIQGPENIKMFQVDMVPTLILQRRKKDFLSNICNK